MQLGIASLVLHRERISVKTRASASKRQKWQKKAIWVWTCSTFSFDTCGNWGTKCQSGLKGESFVSQDVFQVWQRIAHEDLCLNFLWDVTESSFRVHGQEEGAKKDVGRRERGIHAAPQLQDRCCQCDPSYIFEYFNSKGSSRIGWKQKERHLLLLEEFDRFRGRRVTV